MLQHLSNADIAGFLDKVKGVYKYLVLTEHLPADDQFPPNLDKPSGPDIRLYCRQPSGVVLTSPPFDFAPRASTVLCEVADTDSGIESRLRTTVYEL